MKGSSKIRTVLVTGAYGFIGRHVSRIFAQQGYEVHGIGLGDWDYPQWSSWGLANWIPGSIEKAMQNLDRINFDGIVHCAGSGSVSFSIENPKDDFIANVLTLLPILEYMRQRSPATKLVYPSSAAVYGNAVILPITENHVCKPLSPYGFHKHMAESLCFSYASNYNLPISIVRLFSVYGPGLKKQLLWDGCQKAKHNNPVFWGTGDETRDFIHVNDAAKLLINACQNASSRCLVVNGASGQYVRVKDLISRLFFFMGFKQEPQFNNVHKSGDPKDYRADNSLARSLGWIPEIDLDNGLKEYICWFNGERE